MNIKNNKIKTKVIPITQLKINQFNTKLHTEEQIEQIIESIKEFGFNDPIGIDENNMIIEGHGRLLAAKQMGIEEVPVVILEDLTEEQKNAYSIIHNKLTQETPFDYDKLSKEIQSIELIDVSKFNFDINEQDYFDENIEHTTMKKHKIVIFPNEGQTNNLKQFLEVNEINYKEM